MDSIKFGPTAHFEASINGLPEAVETGHEHPRWTLPIQQCNQFKGEHLLPVDQKARTGSFYHTYNRGHIQTTRAQGLK